MASTAHTAKSGNVVRAMSFFAVFAVVYMSF